MKLYLVLILVVLAVAVANKDKEDENLWKSYKVLVPYWDENLNFVFIYLFIF